jgi:2,5-diketo-D-gluconate reductase B
MQRVHGIPLLGYGTYPLAGDECRRCVSTALELGYRHIDTAQNYDNEREVGEAIARSGVKRDEVFLVTKVARDHLMARNFIPSVTESLERLGTDYVDLLLIHWPPEEKDLDTVIDSLCEAQNLKLTRAIGVSNFTIPLLKRAAARARHPIVNNQVEFHPMIDQSRLAAAAKELGIALSAYAPLARGAALKEKAVTEVARRLGRPSSEIVLRWIVQQGVVALPMTTKRENAASNLRIFDFELSAADMAAISDATKQNRRLISPTGWAPQWDTA